ncbi:MAG: hypothetical protein EOM55_00590 [Clostridia bacterium]|nr:hypothetical protein [Clostridia bacterium]
MEKFILETDILTEFQFEKMEESKVRAIILIQDKLKKFLSKDILGRNVVGWVSEAVSDFESEKADILEGQSACDVAKHFVKNEDFLLVLYGDTPLVSQEVVRDALDYAITKNLDFCKLPRGYIFKSSALKKGNFVMSSEANFLSKDDFFSVFDFLSLCKAREIMKENILEKHLKNGVEIFDGRSTYVECDVKIGKNVKILSNNVLKGETVIEDGAILNENNVITDSIVGEKCVVSSSILTKAKLKDGTVTKPFSVIKGEEK